MEGEVAVRLDHSVRPHDLRLSLGVFPVDEVSDHFGAPRNSRIGHRKRKGPEPASRPVGGDRSSVRHFDHLGLGQAVLIDTEFVDGLGQLRICAGDRTRGDPPRISELIGK